MNDRDINKDLDLHKNACDEFKKNLLLIKDLKASGKTDDVSIITVNKIYLVKNSPMSDVV